MKKHQLVLLKLTFLGASALSAAAAVGDKIGANVPVGDGAHLTSFSSTQDVFTLNNGNLVVLWQDQGTVDGNLGGVFGKIFAPNGSVVKATFNLDSGSTGNQSFAQGTALPGGGFAVAWRNSASISLSDVTNSFARVFDAAGNAVSSPVQINSTPSNADLLFKLGDVVPLSDGNFFAVVTQDERGALPNEDDDFIQLFAANGTKIGGNIPVGDGAHLTSFSSTQDVFTLNNGNLVVLWQDQGTVDGNLGGVFGKIFAPNGSVVKATFNLDSGSTGNQSFAQGTALPGGGFAVAWRNSASISLSDVTNSFARVFDAAGNAVSSPVQINSTPSNADLLFKLGDVVPLSDGNFFAVVTQDERGALPNEDDDFIQLFAANGTKIGGNIPVGDGAHLTSFSSTQDVFTLNNGNLVVLWQDQGTVDGNLGGVFGKIFAPNGSVVKATFNLDSGSTGNQSFAQGTALPGGGFAVAWRNSASISLSDVTNSFARVFDAAGNAVSSPVQINSTPSNADLLFKLGDVVPLPDGNFFAVVTQDERGALPNEDDDFIQLFEGPPVVVVMDTTVTSINRKDANPANAATVRWDVVFAASVTGVGAGNFATVNGGSVSGSSVTGVTGSGTTYVVTANTGTGSGTLGLNFTNDSGLTPTTSNEPFTGQVYTIDKTPPAVPSTPDLVAGSDSGASSTDNTTNDNTPTLTGIGENGSTVTLSSSIAGNVGSAVVAGGNWTITTPALANGAHTFTATAADALGNTSASSGGLVVTIDTMAPAAPMGLDLIGASDTGVSTTDDITRDATPTISGDAETGSSVALASDVDGAVGTGMANSPFMITAAMLSDGIHQLSATATDLAGNASGPSAPLQIVIDTVVPVVSGAKDLVINFPAGIAPAPVSYGSPSATDNFSPANPPVVCMPPSGSSFPLGVTMVVCTAMDTAGNMASTAFNVIALEEQPSPGVRSLDTISLRGDSASGPGVPPGATIFNITRAHLGNNGTVIYDASLSGAGTTNVAIFSGPLMGAHSALAVKGTAAVGGGIYGAFSNLAVNAAGDTSFQSVIGVNPSLYSGGAVTAAKGGLAPTGGGETYAALQKPALASEGSVLVTANLQLGSGPGVTVGDDTLLVRGPSAILAREGSPSSIAATAFGQIQPRVVASDASGRYAFSAFLLEAVFDPTDNTALFVGELGAGSPQAILREGDVAAGTGGATFSAFFGEAVNSAGEIVLRANLGGGGITAANNEGLWTTAGNPGAAPVLVAREGDVAPCLPDTLAAFERFASFHLGDDGTICFFAYLKDATGTPAVHSGNDGSLWRWDGGQLHLVAREGDVANNTAGAILAGIGTVSCNGTGGIAFEATLVNGVGDTTSLTNQAVFLDRGGIDPVPLLVLRRGDSFDLGGGDIRSVAGLSTSTELNAGGAGGGYGRAINDAGEILLNLTLSGNSSGIFVLGPPLP